MKKSTFNHLKKCSMHANEFQEKSRNKLTTIIENIVNHILKQQFQINLNYPVIYFNSM